MERDGAGRRCPGRVRSGRHPHGPQAGHRPPYREVGHYLGNTPAVARTSYVDPRVVDRYRHGETIVPALGRLGADVAFGQPSTQGAIEGAVLDLLDDAPPATLAA